MGASNLQFLFKFKYMTVYPTLIYQGSHVLDINVVLTI